MAQPTALPTVQQRMGELTSLLATCSQTISRPTAGPTAACHRHAQELPLSACKLRHELPHCPCTPCCAVPQPCQCLVTKSDQAHSGPLTRGPVAAVQPAHVFLKPKRDAGMPMAIVMERLGRRACKKSTSGCRRSMLTMLLRAPLQFWQVSYTY